VALRQMLQDPVRCNSLVRSFAKLEVSMACRTSEGPVNFGSFAVHTRLLASPGQLSH
jgi:hypothetical protein